MDSVGKIFRLTGKGFHIDGHLLSKSAKPPYSPIIFTSTLLLRRPSNSP
jgi:hypothetical protein